MIFPCHGIPPKCYPRAKKARSGLHVVIPQSVGFAHAKSALFCVNPHCAKLESAFLKKIFSLIYFKNLGLIYSLIFFLKKRHFAAFYTP